MAPALELFEAALALPGSGVRKQKNGPRELSTGERQAALYNIACCQARGRINPMSRPVLCHRVYRVWRSKATRLLPC